MKEILQNQEGNAGLRSALSNAEEVTEQQETGKDSPSAPQQVRVYIVLEAGVGKEEAVSRISQEVFPEAGLDVHNSNLGEDQISANIPYEKIEAVKAVEGVKDVSMVQRDQTTLQEDREAYTETEENQESNQWKDSEKLFPAGKIIGFAAGILFLIIIFGIMILRKRKKH